MDRAVLSSEFLCVSGSSYVVVHAPGSVIDSNLTGTITFVNSSKGNVRTAEITVSTSSGRREFQTEKRSPYDQLMTIRDIPAGKRAQLTYTSLSEQIIDARVTWEDGRTERYYVGYRPDLFTGAHTLEATDTELLIDNVPAGAADSRPTEYEEGGRVTIID
ncbi:MAG: hypothetical protein AABO58_00740 [Acidobacteriota bacterium]